MESTGSREQQKNPPLVFHESDVRLLFAYSRRTKAGGSGGGVRGFRNLLYLLFIPEERKHGAEIIIYDFVILLLPLPFAVRA